MNAVRVMRNGRVHTFDTWAEYVAWREAVEWWTRRSDRVRVRDDQRARELASFYKEAV